MKTILVVDDDRVVVKLCAIVLEHQGFRVASAPDGRKALEVARDANPDLIVMDVNLPGMDGLGAAFLLRSHPDTREIPILAMSGQPAEELRDEAIHLGCVDFLQKPFALTDFVEAVQRILTRTRARVA